MQFIEFVIYVPIYIGLIATTFYILGYIGDKGRKKPLFKDSELPKVSVIIPAWNEEKSIANTIKSILRSDYPKGKFEVIIIDDGSTDKTYEIAKKFKSKNVRVYRKKNGGKEVLTVSVISGYARGLLKGDFRFWILKENDLNKCFLGYDYGRNN